MSPLPNYHVAVVFDRSKISGECRSKTAEMHGKEVLQTHCPMKDPNGNTAWKMQRVLFDKTTWTVAEVKGICSREGWKFEEAQRKYTVEDMPEGKFVRKRQREIKTEGGVLLEVAEPTTIEKRDLESFEYLLHHAHLETESDERLDHCLVSDHLGNLFELDHLEVDGQTYHIIKGLEPTQSVAWSDEEAKEAGISPKEMKAGQTLEEKAQKW